MGKTIQCYLKIIQSNIMNDAHILGKKRNRLNRLNRRLSDKELTSEQRSMKTQRLAELTKELSGKGK